MQQIPGRCTAAGTGIGSKLRAKGEELRSLVEALKEDIRKLDVIIERITFENKNTLTYWGEWKVWEE